MAPHDHHPDLLFMQRALELAVLGRGYVSPNPMVGCVVVHNDKIVSEGWHKVYGGPHAEVDAIAGLDDKSVLKNATLYVNLEPCSHFGKTPPCADLLIEHQVKRIVVANLDPNPLVAGTGIKKLRAAGIEVVTGVLSREGRELNKRFFTFMEKKRPYILLKWAQTADGFIAKENYDSKWISNQYSRQLVHKWRSEEDAILAGTQTIRFDDPQLNVRDWSGPNPVRIIVDRFLRLHENHHVFDGSQKTICYNVLKHEEHEKLVLARIPEEDFVQHLVEDLYQRKIQSLLVEGGARTFTHFITSGLWDEARIFISNKCFYRGIKAPQLSGVQIHQQKIAHDALMIFHPVN